MSNTRPVLVGINGRKAVVRVKNEEPEEDADNLFDDFSVDHDERNEASLTKPEEELFNLLDLDPDDGDSSKQKFAFNEKAVLVLARLFPSTFRKKYNFDGHWHNSKWRVYPLTIICALGASLDTIEVVYTLFPSAAFDALCECPFSRFPLRVVKFLVEANPAVLDEVDEDDSTVLHHSVNVACVSKEVLTYLVGMNKDQLLSQDNDGWTPLHRACACSELVTPLEILPLLIDKEKAVLRMKDIEGKTPLLVACDSNASLDVIEFLVGLFPCALEIEDNDGRVPLHGACANQVNASLEIIRFLVDTNPAMLEIKCRKKGWLPLHVACFDGMKKSIKFLLEKNPDATMEEDYQGRIPLALYSKRDDADMETLGSLVVDLYHESTKGLDHAGNRPLSVEQYDSLLAHMVRQASSKRARTTE